MSQPIRRAFDDFTSGVLDEAAFARSLADIPELAHLPIYNIAAVPELMRQIGTTIDLADLARRAADPNTAPESLIFLAGIYPAEFCANPALPLLLLEDPGLPARFEPVSLGRLLSHSDVPADFLEALALLGQPGPAQAARLHVGLAGQAGAGWRDEIARAVAELPGLPADDLLPLLLALGRAPAWLAEPLAARLGPRPAPAAPAPPADDLGIAGLVDLLDSDDPAERARAAADPRTPPELLAQARDREFWGDGDPAVFKALAANPSSPPEVLLAIAADRLALNTAARRAVAHNPSASADALALLVDEPYAMDIPLALAAHPNTSDAQRARMAATALENAWEGGQPLYRAIALSQPDTSAERLAAQARSPFWVERLAVALHPRTPAATRATLADDGNRLVCAAARET